MRDFEVQTVELAVPFDAAFAYVADARTLPEWTHAFRSVSDGRATMATPNGTTDVGLRVDASRETGTVDWTMTFPDGSVARAFSRLIPRGDRTLFSFVLTAPPVPLERLEGALDEQARVLREELAALRRRLARP
jgi:hypothetical protein